MAKKQSKGSKTALERQDEATAPLDSSAFLAAAKPVLKALQADLLARADGSPSIVSALRARWCAEIEAHRTADAFELWRRNLVTQVAAAWLLSMVFARTLEDRGLLDRNRIAGPGALDSQQQFLQLAPYLSERDYLLEVFRELSRIPAVAALFDARHCLVWLLAPSAGAAKTLLALFRAPDADGPAYRFGQRDTRFLGDLYERLDEQVRDRYGLLQTPHFVESFILDQTLELAIEDFGLETTSVVDPTCGSGHFLLGAFDRIFEHRLRATPGIDSRDAVRLALGAIHGVDINPYSIAIARVRLTLAALEKCGIKRIGAAPKFDCRLVVADTLLHTRRMTQSSFADAADQSVEAWEGSLFGLEDEPAAREMLRTRFTVVVGNPPFGAPHSRSIKDVYRSMYRAATGKYVLAAPFVECFFALGAPNAYVGMINSSTFANHKFGRALIEQVLPDLAITCVVNTSGVYFPPPGFSVPTVIMFGRNSPPGPYTLSVRQVGLDPGEYSDPGEGVVWRSIREHWDQSGFSDEWIEVHKVPSTEVRTYPWRLSGGPGAVFVDSLEGSCSQELGALTSRAGLGAVAMSNADKLFIQSEEFFARKGLLSWTRPHLSGETFRDFMCHGDERVFWPYDEELRPKEIVADHALRAWLEPFRPMLEARATFRGGTYLSDGKLWYGWHQLTESRIRVTRRVFLPEIATEANALFDDGSWSASQSLVCFVPSDTLSDDAVAALVGYLNSSALMAWVRKRCAPVSTARGDVSREKGRSERFRLPAGSAKLVPVPDALCGTAELDALAARLAEATRRLFRLGKEREAVWTGLAKSLKVADDPGRALREVVAADDELRDRSVVFQEEADWTVYAIVLSLPLPLVPLRTLSLCRADPGQRPFCAPSGTYTPAIQGEFEASAIVASAWSQRRSLLLSDSRIADAERWMFKRTWLGQRGVFGRNRKDAAQRGRQRLERALAQLIEELTRGRDVVSTRELALSARSGAVSKALSLVAEGTGDSEADLLAMLLRKESVPFASALRFTESGIRKWGRWQELQAIPSLHVPPSEAPERFEREDFVDENVARMRGEFDCARERFISYPGCESDLDRSPVYGWAGWNHLQQAQALAALYLNRKEHEGWKADRLVPMLAGVHELGPWLKHWHNEPNAEFGGERLGDYFARFVDDECRALAVSQDDLRAWRPAAKGRKATAKSSPAAHDGEGAEAHASKPKKPRKSKKQPEPAPDGEESAS